MAAYRNMGGRSKYARKAYQYVNSHGKTVRVPARPGLAPPKRKSRAKTPGVRRSAVPAPAARPRARRASIQVRVPVRLPGSRLKSAVSLKGEKQRLTQKHATRNFAKRVARKQVRKAIPGFRTVRITRRRRRR